MTPSMDVKPITEVRDALPQVNITPGVFHKAEEDGFHCCGLAARVIDARPDGPRRLRNADHGEWVAEAARRLGWSVAFASGYIRGFDGGIMGQWPEGSETYRGFRQGLADRRALGL